MMQHGRRNISISTVAPTGSLSLLTQTTSGIEPVYMIYYTRRRKLNPNDKLTRVDFVDELGDKWQEYTVFHPKFETYLRTIGMSEDEIYNIKENGTKEQINELVKNSPYYNATAMDIDWEKRVHVQATVQKYVTHSISSTVNLPENVEVKTVGDIYMKAWENKLKGITIYRDGSRSGVLVSKKDKEQQENDLLFKDNHAPKRPKRLKADILRFQNNMEKWIAVVGLLDGRPYEIFTGKLENGLCELSPNITSCEVVKVKLPEGKTRYDIEYIDAKGDKITHTGLNHTFNKEFWNYAKMASAILRHGMPLTYAVELINSLNLADDHLNTWKNGVSRVLKKYIKEGTIKGKCDNCGGENLEFIEGCLTCKDCGSSKCS
jgi:ribonucleoside-diphosphate reductase alpha chain